MHVRRSLLVLLLGGILLLTTSLLFLYRSSYIHLSPWATHVDNPLDVHQSWPDPEPGDETLRKNPPDQHETPTSNKTPKPVGSPSLLLQSRLQTFLDAPILNYIDAASKNEETCPRSVADKQVNQDQLHGNLQYWRDISQSDIQGHREAIVDHLRTLEKDGTEILGLRDKPYGGRGIVMTAGNKGTAQTALVTLRMLRDNYKSNLPVQIFSFPGEITSTNILDQLGELGATSHELELQKSAGAWKNFHLKAAAIIASNFTEVLYLDSDNVPLRDPAYLFDETSYTNGGGAVFWPDYNKDHPDNAVWRVLGKTCTYTEWEVESGQILIDKRGNNGLNLAALHIASHMQANHDFWFRLSGGDKDTFRYAFWVLEATYSVAPRWLSALGATDAPGTWQEGRFCGVVMLQHDIKQNSEGEYLPLFLHANLLKHRYYSGQSANKLFHIIKRPSHDDANEPSLNRVRIEVYDQGGMCVDMDVEAASGNRVGAGWEQKLTLERFEEVHGGMFKNFEDQWKLAGGQQGGW
ncbi:mannosyltransferase putative-domain-containing protein [Hysterangium stoloniferum]|nr:mannosyltransferase putative-domain-containing protein [Hysterangium stoloniferum]